MGSATNKNVVFENMALINGKPMVANPSGPEHGGAIWAIGVDTLTIEDCILGGTRPITMVEEGLYGLDYHFRVNKYAFCQ